MDVDGAFDNTVFDTITEAAKLRQIEEVALNLDPGAGLKTTAAAK